MKEQIPSEFLDKRDPRYWWWRGWTKEKTWRIIHWPLPAPPMPKDANLLHYSAADGCFAGEILPFPGWTESYEIPGQAYELTRRHDRRHNWPPYPSLDRELRDQLFQEIPISRGPITFRDLSRAPRPVPPNWIPMPAGYCNIDESPDAFAQAWKQWLIRQRQKLGITSTAGPKGKRNRHVSYRWLEVMDLRYYHPEIVLDSNDTSKLSKARVASKECYANLRTQLTSLKYD